MTAEKCFHSISLEAYKFLWNNMNKIRQEDTMEQLKSEHINKEYASNYAKVGVNSIR